MAFTQDYSSSVDTILNKTNLDSLVYFVRNLSGEDPVMINGSLETIEHRVSNWGNDLSADYISQTLEGYGLEVENQVYASGGRNIIGIQEGTVYPDEYYMICAHYDAVTYYCADDNASGTAGVMEAARIFKDYNFEYSIIYALWDEEEIGLIGSGHYATQAANNNQIIHGVVNMDMIAWDSDDDMVVEIHTSNEASSYELANYVVEIDNLYGLDVVPAVQNPGTSASDHSRFWNNGYKACLLIEEYYGGDFNPYYHSEEDRISIFNLPYFHEMAILAVATVSSLASPVIETSISENDFALNGVFMNNAPNPFSNETTISYTLQDDTYISLSVLNSMGKQISILEEGYKTSGQHGIKFSGQDLSAGMYFLVTQTPEGLSTHKMVISR